MATEINIQESVFLKKGEREESELTGESFEEKLTELPGNIMKQLESSSLVAETVNTPLETGKPINESETFFQALSVPVIITDEHSNKPESCKAAKQTETEENAEVEVESELFDSVRSNKKDDVNMLEKNQGVSDGFTSSQDAACEEDIKETTGEQHATSVADFKDQDLNTEFVKEETEGKSVNAQEASEQCEIESKDIDEKKFKENTKKIEQDIEIKPDVELEKQEQNGSLQAITSDSYISTDTKSQVETAEHEQKDEDVNVLEEDKDKSEITSAQEEVCEEDSQEKNHHSEDNEHQVVDVKGSIEEDNDVCVSTQIDLVEESIKNEEINDKKATEKEVGEENDPKKAENGEEIKVSDIEAPGQKETYKVSVNDEGDSDDFKEHDLIENPREFINEETEDKSLDAQEASEECENVAKNETEQYSEKSDEKIEKDTDVFMSTQTKLQVEKTEHEEEEKSDSPLIKEQEVHEETGSEKVEYEKEIEDSANKDEDEKKEQEVKDGVTSAKDVTENDLQEKNHHNKDDEPEVVTAVESIEKDTEDDKSSEITKQQMQIDSNPSDVCISTQTELEENTTEKNAKEETEKYDDGANGEKEQKLEESVDETAHSYSKSEVGEYNEETKPSDETIEEKDVCISTQIESQEDATKNEENDFDKSDNPFKENDLKKTETEEEIQLSDSSNVKSRESVDADTERGIKHSEVFDMTLNENEIPSKEEKEEKIKASEVQGGGDDVTSSHKASNEDIKETANRQHDNEQYVEETIPCLNKTVNENPEDEIQKDKKTLSQESVEDTNDYTTKEEKGMLEQETEEEQSGQDDVSIEQVIDSNETTKIEPQEFIVCSTSLETSTKDTSNSDLETVSDVQIPELVPKSDDSVLKEECLVSETETHLDEEKEIVTKEISIDEKTKVQGGGDDVTSSHNTSSEDRQETTTDQHDAMVAYIKEEEGVSAMSKEIPIEEADYKSVDAEEIPLELVQSNEQNLEETLTLSKNVSQNPEAEINKEDKDLSHESVENTNDTKEKSAVELEPVKEHNGPDEVSNEEITGSNGTTEVEPQEDLAPSSSLETSTNDTSNSEKGKTESENLLIENVETVSDLKITEMVPKSEESFISETETRLDEVNGTLTEVISNDEETKQTTEIKQEAVKEVCEQTSLEKAEIETLKPSDSSTVEEDEKEIAFIIDDQEKDHEVNISAESQFRDDITSSKNEEFEEKENLQEKNCHAKGVDEDREEIKSSVETKESTEHVITTNVCSSTQIQPDKETEENEEKISEKAIENDDNEIVSKEENLEKKQDDVEETNMGEHINKSTYNEEGRNLDTMTKNVINKEEDKFVVTQEETKQNDDGATDEREQKTKEHTNDCKPGVETNKEKYVCISTEIESQEDATKNDEHAIENDGDQKEKLDDPFVKEVCEETDLKTVESEEERQILDSFNVNTRESEVEDTEEPKSNDDTNDNIEHQGLVHVITPDVYSSTQPEDTEKSIGEENNDDVQTEKPESSLVEATSSEIVKHSESFGTTLNEDETLIKEEKLEVEHEIQTTLEVQGNGNDVTSTHNASNEDIQETTIGQHDSIIAYVEHEGQDVSARPKEILTEEAENKSIDAEEVSLELGQPDKQYVDETCPSPSKTLSENPEEDIKKQNKDLSPESVKDTDDTTKEEECTLKQEPIEENSGRDDVSKENAICLNETTEVEPQEDITPSNPIEKSTEDASNSESVLKKEIISEIGTRLGEDKETVTKEISSDEKKEHTAEFKQETVNEICEEEKAESEEGLKLSDSSVRKINEEVTTEQQPEETVNNINSGSETIKESIQEEDAGNKKPETAVEEDNEADIIEDRSEMKDEVILTENVSTELGQAKEQNVEEIQACITETISEKTEDEITKKNEDLSHDNVTKEEKCFPDENTKEIEISTLEHELIEEQNDSQNEVSDGKSSDLNNTTTMVTQEDVTPSSSQETSTKDIFSDENLETHGSTQQPENAYNNTEENVTQLEHENRDMKESVTQESQLNTTEDCREMVKDVILTEVIEQVPVEIEKEKGITDFKQQTIEEDSYSPEVEVKSAQNQKEIVHEISNSDSIPVENPEVTEVNVDAQIGQEALNNKEEISCVSKVTNDRIDQEPTEEINSSQVDSTNIESTAYPSEHEKLATRTLESDCVVQIPELVADSEDLEVKEECIVSATAENTYGNNVEEKEIKTNDISSSSGSDQENVTSAPVKSDEAQNSDLIIQEKGITKENLEVHGELEPTYEPVIEDQVSIEAKPQPELSDITSESVKSDPTLECHLEHTSGKDSDGKEEIKDVTLAPENEFKSIENQNEAMKNIILSDEVAMKTENEKKKNEIKHVSEEDIFPTEIENTSTPNQNELGHEIEYSKPIPIENTGVTEEKAESQIEVENIQAAENPSGLSKPSSIIETSIEEMHKDTEQTITGEVNNDSMDEASKDDTIPVLEDSKALENKAKEHVIINEIERSGSRPDELLETQKAVQDTKDPKCMADNPNVKDDTFTEVKGPNEEGEITVSEYEMSENMVTEKNIMKADADKETITLDESQAHDSAKHSILSSTKQDVVARSEESKGLSDMLKLEEKPTEVSKIATEIAEIVPKCREASVTNFKNTEDPEVLPSVEKDVIEGVDKSFEQELVIDVQKHEKDLDLETKVITSDVVSKIECSEIEPPCLNTKEKTTEIINQENQSEQENKDKERIEAVIPIENVTTSTREVEVRSVDFEVPPVMDATANKADNKSVEVHDAEKGLLIDNEHLESKCDQSKPVEEGSKMKQEPLVQKTLGTTTTVDLKISQKCVTDDMLHEPAKENSKEAENLIGEKDSALTKDQRVEKEETGESGVKTDEEEDNEDDEKIGLGSDAPVMVEASKDIDAKVHKKSHNILSGVGSKVKHSIAKVKKAITGKSSPQKSPSPKANNQVVD